MTTTSSKPTNVDVLLQIGSVVYVKNHAETLMTVESLGPTHARCVRFNKENQLRREWFTISSLVLVENESHTTH